MCRRRRRLQGQPPGWRKADAAGVHEEPDRGPGEMLRVALLLQGGEQISRLVRLVGLPQHKENGILDLAQVIQLGLRHPVLLLPISPGRIRSFYVTSPAWRLWYVLVRFGGWVSLNINSALLPGGKQPSDTLLSSSLEMMGN